MEPEKAESSEPDSQEMSRRKWVTGACTATMGGALLAGYGTFFGYAGKYLYPSKPPPKGWMFVIQAAAMKVGDALGYKTPSGASVAIARQGDKGDVSDFIALSSRCPHLGCAVHWEGQNDRFFCPCHNGVFDPRGQPVSGPPADANQSLPTYPLKLEDGLLFIEVDLESLASNDAPEQHACNRQTEPNDSDHENDNDGGIA